MTAVVALGVIALVVAIVAWVTWHRGADERQSVQHHQHTLETLRHVADRRRSPGWPAPGRRAPAGDPSKSARESAKRAASRRVAVFADDAAARRRPLGRTSTSPGRRMGGRLPGAAEQARRDGRARVRRTRIVAGAAVLVVGGAVGGELALGRSNGPSGSASRATSHTSKPITAAGRGLSTTTVVPRDLVPMSPTAFSADYAAPSTAYAVTVHASAMCWIMATEPSSGHVVWTGTIGAGASRSWSVSGDLAVRLGAPTDALVTMDGRPVQLPSGFRAPFTLTFETVA